MKKRILSFVLLMLMILTSFASASGIAYVSVEGDIRFSTVTFSNDGTNVIASLEAVKAQGTDNVTLMMTLYNSNKKLIDASSDTKTVSTEAVELKATAPVPQGDFTAAATLYNAANGLSPIASPAMSDYEGATDLLDLTVDGVSVADFKSDVYSYQYVVEGVVAYPEIGATVREGASKVSVSYEDKFPGTATITVENGLGTVSSVYEIEFSSLKHIVVGATTDAMFKVDSGTNLNLVSSNAVSSGVGGKNVYTNLTGADDDSLDYGSRWTTDYMPLGSHHAIRYVDPMLQGWDYFICANGTMKADAGDYFDFEVNHNARIVVVAIANEPGLVANGFEALPTKKYAMASYAAGAATEDVRADLNGLGIKPTFADMYFYNQNAKDHEALVKYFVEKYNLDEELAAANIPVNRKVSIPELTYQFAYSKFYEAYEDEPARVVIPAPQATQGRGYIVAVIPVGEDGELPGGGNEGGDTPDNPGTPDIPVVPDEPEEDLGDLVSLVDGKTYSQYIDYVNSVVSADKAMTKEATVSETQKISTNHNKISTINEDGALCSVTSWRVFKNVAEGWKGLNFMTSDPSFYQEASGRGWPVAVFSGKKASYEGDVCEAADNQVVPWWNIKVNKDMNVSIVTDKELTHLTKEEYGSWTKLTIGTDIENPFKIYDNRSGSAINGANKYVYTKSYKAGDTVVLYNENSKNIGYVPYVAVFGTPDVEGGDEPGTPDEPTLAEGNHVIVGARYSNEIVADADVTNGFKSASDVTSAKHSKTDGVVYTNLRGNEDESQPVYGARWACDFAANRASYHEIFYVDDSLKGLDYFAFKAGSDAYNDDLLKFKVTSDVEINIITANANMSFGDYTKEENANGWIKGRFINRDMTYAMEAVGVKPLYSVVSTYKPAEKDAFYNTYLKTAYEAANADAKALFDTNWAKFGTNVALSQNLAYKAKYSKTYTMPAGAEEMEITVPGNTTDKTSRDIIVVVKPLAQQGGDEPEVPGEPERELAEGFHPIVGARYADEITADAGAKDGKKSVAKVTTAGKMYDGIVYSPLRGKQNGDTIEDYGSKWVIDSYTTAVSGQHHEIYYVDENLVGYDYFTANAGDKSYAESPLIEFELAETAEVVILSIREDFAIDGFDKEKKDAAWAKARYFDASYANAIRKLGAKPDFDIAQNIKTVGKDAFISTYYADEYAALSDATKAEFETLWAKVTTNFGSTFDYKYAHSKTYTVPEGETLKVKIPGDTSGSNHRTPIIIVKPVDEAGEEPEEPDLTEDSEVVAVVAKINAIGTVTLDSESAIQEARAAFEALSAEKKAVVANLAVLEAAEAALETLKEAAQPELAEGDHVVKGAQYKDEFVADVDVTDGFKSASAVTSAKSGKTTGILYTGLRGNPDEAGTVYGARLTSMPANSVSYHEIYYVDETLEGKDYFVFTAGSNLHNDATLLKFEITADAQVDILATNNAMSFDGFKLTENANGWIKGRFINRNMADAMNAIGVKPIYSVVKTYKPAEKEAFYNTYLKEAYEAASDSAKANFDAQWATFGNATAIGNDSAYKAMYSKTFRLADGEDTMEVIVPGNTTSNQSRNIIVVVRSASEEEEEPDLTEDAEVVAVVAKINAIGTVTLDSESAIQEARAAYEALSDEKKAVVANLAVLEAAEAALEALKEAAVPAETVGELTHKVHGLTYPQYLAYVEEVTGVAPVSTSVIKDTETIRTYSTNGSYAFSIRETFGIGKQMGGESARRVPETISEEYSFIEGVKFFSPTIEWSQEDVVRRLYTNIFWGLDSTYTYNGFDYTVKASTDALPTVPFWTVPVTDATLYLASYVEMPHLETAGWTKAATTAPVFTFKDTNNNNILNGPEVVYTMEVGETTEVELPNSNTGSKGTYPYFVFFVPNN